MNETFRRFLDGEIDPLEGIMDVAEEEDSGRKELTAAMKRRHRTVIGTSKAQKLMRAEKESYYRVYNVVAVISCILLIGVLLFTVAHLPRYGAENPRATEVMDRYIERGVEETGAVNVVAGMILDYRAFDTLGESHVLFTALVCVMILLIRDKKNMRTGYEDYYTTTRERFHDLTTEAILRNVAIVLIPCIFVYGLYVLLNGQNGPGGGFSGGAVMGSGLIIASAAFGFDRMDRFFTARVSAWITFSSLAFYSFAKGYVFFTGANGIPNGVPKGTPGHILSGGLILPLDIAVGLVVACTMFGFYSLFRRGTIGGAS